MYYCGTSASIRGKKYDPTEMRIVLLGGRRLGEPSGMSSVGNIILGRDVFNTNRRTAKSVMRQEVVSGRQVTVVDTPGWITPRPLDLTPKLTQLEIQQSVYLCPPGPHAFVLVMPLDRPSVGTELSLEEHVGFLLSGRAWIHTIVVFTVADKNKMSPDIIRSDYYLRSLTKKCEERFYVLNITDKGDKSQVTELLEKIEQMVTSNGCHYETEQRISEELKEMERTIRRRAEQRRTDAQKEVCVCETGVTHLRILLLGRWLSGKTSAGNTILGEQVFKVGPRSVRCEVRHGEVAGTHLTVVDSPGWYYNSSVQDSSEMDKLEIQNSVTFCPLGPHAVLLMVPVDRAFTKAQRVAVEEHMELLSQRVWRHTMVLFTWGDCLGDVSIEQHIEAEGEDLRWLVDKCGNRYHVFNNQKRGGTQVTELLEKIKEMVAGNEGGHYEVDGDVSEKLSERKRNIEVHVQTFMTRTHRQRAALKALFEGEHRSLQDVRVMLVGGEQDGRSEAANFILQDDVFTEPYMKEFKTQSKLTQCDFHQRKVSGRNVSVVICPDWSTTPPSQKIKDVLLHGVTLCSPGPHAVLVTVDGRSSFSEADRRSVEEHMVLLGVRVWRHTLVLFTWGWWLGERCVEEYIESEGEPLRWILEKCGYRYHVLQWDFNGISELMEKIEDMATRNRGHLVEQERLDKRMTLRYKEEQWRRRGEEMIDRMLKFVVKEPEEPTLPAARKRKNSIDIGHCPPSMSGGTPSETGSSYRWSPAKVSDWLLKRHPGTIVSSAGYDTMSDAPSQTEADVTVPLIEDDVTMEQDAELLSEEALSETLNAEEEETILADKSLLEQQVESVKVELETKNIQLQQRDKKLMEMNSLVETNAKLEESLKKLQQENKDYKARVDRLDAFFKLIGASFLVVALVKVVHRVTSG